MSDPTHSNLDINASFRGGGRAVECLDEINKASIVMLAETGIVARRSLSDLSAMGAAA